MRALNNIKEYETLTKGNKPVLIDFYADWCQPCQAFLPIVEKLASKYNDEMTITKVNVDTNNELAQKFNVKSIPAVFIVKDSEVKESFVGLQTEAFLDKKILSYTAN